jgi:hypothetical protein
MRSIMVSKALIAAAAFSLGLAGAQAALADIGPKPTMAFAFSFAKKRLTVAKGSLLMCEDARCSLANPLERLGPQGLTCEARACSATAYGFARFARLEVTLSNGRTLRSNVFTSANDGAFRVLVGAARLVVQPQR